MYKPSEYYFVLAYIVGVLKLFGDYENSAEIMCRHLLATGMLHSFKQINNLNQ